jgi:hypothetical protein
MSDPNKLSSSSGETEHDNGPAKHDLASFALTSTVELKDREDMNTSDFEVTTPESRTYSPYEEYKFLVHVPLGDVMARGDEIGHSRDGVLMTSLVANTRQATFNGEGGFIVGQPPEELITGTSAFDVGGEISNGDRAAVNDLVTPASLAEYSQVDMKFEATTPTGVMIKRAADDGREIGTRSINESLRAYAEEHGLPVAEVLVLPDELITERRIRNEQLANGAGDLVTVDIPAGDDHFFRAQILHGSAYHMQEGETSAARVMKISNYAETTQELTPEDRQKVLDSLNDAVATEDGVTQADIETVIRDTARLEQSQENAADR